MLGVEGVGCLGCPSHTEDVIRQLNARADFAQHPVTKQFGACHQTMLQKHGVASINRTSSCKICSCHNTLLLHFLVLDCSCRYSANIGNPTGSPDGPKEYNATSELHFGKSHATKHFLRNVQAKQGTKIKNQQKPTKYSPTHLLTFFHTKQVAF